MSAFDALEQRILNLTLGATSPPDAAQPVVVGLCKVQPAENHNGQYGQFGEPLAGLTGSGYHRALVTFGLSTVGAGGTLTSNSAVVTLTGLTPGTYTHFALFGSNKAGT